MYTTMFFKQCKKTLDDLAIIMSDIFFLGMLKYLQYGYPNANYKVNKYPRTYAEQNIMI